MNLPSIFNLALLCCFVALVSSCSKDQQQPENSVAIDVVTSQVAFADVFKQMDQAVKNNLKHLDGKGLSLTSVDTCKEISIQGEQFPKALSVKFNKHCAGQFGIARSGEIKADFTGAYSDSGSRVAISLAAFQMDEQLVNGALTVTNTGRNKSDHYVFREELTEGRVKLPNGRLLTLESSLIKEWVEGETSEGSFNFCDDVYSVEGTFAGEDGAGRTFKAVISEPLQREICCPWFVSGQLQITPEGLSKRIINFGDGACDARFTVQVDDEKFTYNLMDQ